MFLYILVLQYSLVQCQTTKCQTWFFVSWKTRCKLSYRKYWARLCSLVVRKTIVNITKSNVDVTNLYLVTDLKAKSLLQQTKWLHTNILFQFYIHVLLNLITEGLQNVFNKNIVVILSQYQQDYQREFQNCKICRKGMPREIY